LLLKRLFFSVFVILFIITFFFGCNKINKKYTELLNDSNFIKSYKDIPGITNQEIASIEALKSSGKRFSYGTILATESFLQKDGSYSGFVPLFAAHLSQLFDIPFDVIFYEWDDLLNGTDNFSIDFLSELTPTNERMQKYFMTSAIAERSLSIFIKDDAVGFNSTEDLKGLKIGFFEGTITEQSIKNAYPELYFDSVYIDTVYNAAQMLWNNTVDAVIIDEPSDYEFNIYGNITSVKLLPLVYTPISLSSANPELEPVISVLNKYLEAGGIDKIHSLYTQGERSYAQFMFDLSLTDEERAYITNLADNKLKVPVTMEPDNYPICFFDEKIDDFHGISVDIIKEISSLSGIEFETVTNKNSSVAEILEIVKSGRAAFDAELIHTDGRENDFLFPNTPYFKFHFALLSRMDFPDLKIYQVAKAVVGVVTGNAPAEMFELLVPGSSGYKEYRTRNEALDALEKGEIELFLTTDYMILYQTHYREKTGYKINILLNSMVERSFFGFNVNEKILCSIIDKAMSRIDIDKIIISWTNRVYDYSKKLAADRFLYMTIFASILSVLLIILIFILIKYYKMIGKLDKQKELLNIVNQVSSVLLEPEPLQELQSYTEHFEENIKQSMGIIAEAIGVDRICIWINSGKEKVNNSLCFSLGFEWENGKFRSRLKEGNLAPDLNFDEHPIWNNTLSQGNCINSLVCDMSPKEQSELTPRNILSIFVVPVFFHDTLWGFVGFDRCNEEKTIADNEVLILRSASRMLANTVIRNDMTHQLEVAKEQAEQSNKSKSIFLSHMSHEIRTPMNAILGIAEIQLQKETLMFDKTIDNENNLADFSKTPYHEISESFEKIYESGNLLLNIINDILDLSKIESGKLEIIPLKYDLPSLINDTVQLNRLRYESKPIEFSLDLADNMPVDLIGDVLRIKQVLNNLLSNAFKYTDQGKIDFYIAVEPDRFQKDDVTLIFKVSDTGQGMTEEQLTKLFDEYTRFNLEINRTTVGAGLGMSISKRLIELMNGEIYVESVPDKGSMFTVRLPQKRAGTEVFNIELINKLKSFNFHSSTISKKVQFLREYMPYGSILVVDDVESNIYVAKGMMIPYGLKIDTASSGFEAIKKVEDGNVYDIIFMDHMMPKMDGIEAVKIIREKGYNHPIVALTANAIVGRKNMFLKNGFDNFISKPIDSRELDFVLVEYIKNRKSQEEIENARRVSNAERAAMQREAWNKEDTKAFRIIDFFVRDAESAIKVLEKINIDDSEIDSYITAVHGIKSALANIGEKEFSLIASKLEHAGRQHNFELLKNATPAFVNTLKNLVINFKSFDDIQHDDVSNNDSNLEINQSLLNEKFTEIKNACAEYDKKTAKTALDVLKKEKWTSEIKKILHDISVHLLHSEFKEIEDLVVQYIK